MVKRFEVYFIGLAPTLGSEIQKRRPCVVISPNEMHGLNSVIVAPLTTTSKAYPTRIPVKLAGKKGYIILDQICTIDKMRLGQFLGVIDGSTASEVLHVLREMFTV